jgi:O-Antigen ligase
MASDSVEAISPDVQSLRERSRFPETAGASTSSKFGVRAEHSTFSVLAEAYLMVGLIRLFGVISPSFFKQQQQLTWLIALAGVVLVAIAPTGSAGKVRVNVFALVTMGWYALSGFWTANGAVWQDFMFYLLAIPFLISVLMGIIPFERVMLTLNRLTYGVIAWTFAVAAIMPSRTTIHEKTGDDPALPGWHGTFVHKNEMMTFLIVGMISVLCFERNRRLRWGAVALVLVLGVLGQSGTGLAVVILTLLGYGSIRRLQAQEGKRRELFLLSIIGAWAVLAATLLVLGPTLVRLYGKDLTFTGRTRIWSAALDAIGQHPWRGHGIGSVWVDFATQPTAGMERSIGFRAAHAHNGALELLLEVGVVGFVAWLLCFVLAFQSCWRIRRVAPDAARWGMLMCGAIVQLSVSETSTFRGPWVFVVAMTGLMASAVSSRSGRANESTSHAEWPERLSN